MFSEENEGGFRQAAQGCSLRRRAGRCRALSGRHLGASSRRYRSRRRCPRWKGTRCTTAGRRRTRKGTLSSAPRSARLLGIWGRGSWVLRKRNASPRRWPGVAGVLLEQGHIKPPKLRRATGIRPARVSSIAGRLACAESRPTPHGSLKRVKVSRLGSWLLGEWSHSGFSFITELNYSVEGQASGFPGAGVVDQESVN